MTQYRIVKLAGFEVYRIEYLNWRGVWKPVKHTYLGTDSFYRAVKEYSALESAQYDLKRIIDAEEEADARRVGIWREVP